MIKVYGIHGIREWKGGKNSIDRLKPHFDPAYYEWVDFDYPWTFVIGSYLWNGSRAQRLADLVEPGSIVIGHSNGCAIANEASFLTTNISKLVYINPALDVDRTCGPGVKAVDVWYSENDNAVWLAQWLPWSTWGAMGRYGYQGPDARYMSFNEVGMGHGKVFGSLKHRNMIAMRAPLRADLL